MLDPSPFSRFCTDSGLESGAEKYFVIWLQKYCYCNSSSASWVCSCTCCCSSWARYQPWQGTTLAGLGIDLQRCFKTLARYPLIGIPGSYVCGWARMLQDMTRTISIGLAHSRPMASSTGVSEDCGMSVVAMAVISGWQASVILHDHNDVRPIAYADNWNLVSSTVRSLLDSTETLLHFVLTLRLTISPHKSWVWATNSAGRRQL